MSTDVPVINVYDLRCYEFGKKDPQPEKDRSVHERMQRMADIYERHKGDSDGGVRRSVDGVLLVHQHGHPHVLLLQIGNHMKGFFKLPGGKCRKAETDEDGMRRKLSRRLAPPGSEGSAGVPGAAGSPEWWDVQECVSVWYRPTFETYMFPYLPPHITRPKEIKKLFLAQLPPKAHFFVPSNFNFLAIPFFELYDNSKRYGPAISSIPQCLSRFRINMVPFQQGSVPRPLPPAQQQQYQYQDSDITPSK